MLLNIGIFIGVIVIEIRAILNCCDFAVAVKL